MVLLALSNSVVFLVVEPNSSFVFGDSVVGECLEEVGLLIHNHIVLDIGIFLILELEVVLGELLDGQVGGKDSTIMGKKVGSFSHSSVGQVFKVGLISVSHGYDN